MVSGLSPAGTVSPTGLARLWRSSRLHPQSASAATARRARLARQREDIENASRRGFLGQVLDRVGEPERAGWIARVHFGRYDRAGPAANAGDERDILPSVR